MAAPRLVIGESLSARCHFTKWGRDISAPDAIDLGDRNMFIISHGGNVSGDDLVTTNGIFEIIGLAATNIFPSTPIDHGIR